MKKRVMLTMKSELKLNFHYRVADFVHYFIGEQIYHDEEKLKC